MGRVDNFTAVGNPGGLLPDVHANASSLLTLFENKGFTAGDLAALVGAHTSSKNVGQTDMIANIPQDSTPGIWDTQFYADTINQPAGMESFASDIALAADPIVGPAFANFIGANTQNKWQVAFAHAMEQMALLGVPAGANPHTGMIDCTRVIPATQSIPASGKGGKRDASFGSVFGRSAGSQHGAGMTGRSPHSWH